MSNFVKASVPDPEERVFCSCGWKGQVKDAKSEPYDQVRCPKCDEPVEIE